MNQHGHGDFPIPFPQAPSQENLANKREIRRALEGNMAVSEGPARLRMLLSLQTCQSLSAFPPGICQHLTTSARRLTDEVQYLEAPWRLRGVDQLWQHGLSSDNFNRPLLVLKGGKGHLLD